jgi:hypothetical protein
LIEKSPEFVGMKRHRASPLGLTCDGFAFSIQTYGVKLREAGYSSVWDVTEGLV